jgi:ribonuclease HI
MRVFTDGSKTDNETPLGQPCPPNTRPKKISAITAGKHAINENGDHISGGGAWFKKDAYTNISIKPAEGLSSPDSGELCAILRVLKQVPKNKKLLLHIQSKYIFKALTTDFRRNESLGWLYNSNAEIVKAIIAEL